MPSIHYIVVNKIPMNGGYKVNKTTEKKIIELVSNEAKKIKDFSNAEYSYLRLESDLIGIIRYEITKQRDIARLNITDEKIPTENVLQSLGWEVDYE